MSTNLNNIYFSTLKNRTLNLSKLFLIFNKKKKKIISVYGLFAELNRCLLMNIQVCFYYYNAYLANIINLLKQRWVVSNYYLVQSKDLHISHFWFITSIYTIFFANSTIYGYTKNGINYIYSISRPRRIIYVSYKKLLLLVESKNNLHYILNTSLGVMFEQQALLHRQGGQLLCQLK